MTAPAPLSAPGPGSRLAIGRLTLDVPWMSEQDARRLAVLVAEALRRGTAGPTLAGRLGRLGRLDGLAVAVQPPQPATGTDLAGPIARAVLDAVLKELS